MSIKILYDDGGFGETHGGVSRYFTEMMKRLPDGFEWKLGMVGTLNVYLQRPPFNLPPHKQTVQDFIRDTMHGHSFRGVSHVYKVLAYIMPRRFQSGEMANRNALAEAYKHADFDVLHLTHPHPVNNVWRDIVGRKPIVVTVHDLIPEMFQSSRRVASCRRQLLNVASHIIAVSENTKKDIIRLYGVAQEKISVIYHGFMPVPSHAESCDKPDRPYILYVGKRKDYKNFEFLVRAIRPLLKTEAVMLLCTGSAFTPTEYAFLKRLGVEKTVVQRFVTDDEMPGLFSGAACFVYPSLYEGFGIPILDAFSAGCPVVLSRCSCFPEVAGDAALYFDDGDGATLCSNIETLLYDSSIRELMIEKGRNRLIEYSWDKCAQETAQVYRMVANKQ